MLKYTDPGLFTTFRPAVFHDGLERFRAYLLKAGAGFSPSELITTMDSFKDLPHAHLKAEPPAIVALAKHSSREHSIDILAIADAAGRAQIGLGMVFNVIPVFFLNMDTAEFEAGMWQGVFPPFKGPAKWIMTRAVPTWHSNRWRFASCTPEGRYKQLVV